MEVLTRNLVPGSATYAEDLVKIDGVEYRRWDPFRSKLAAGIVKGLPKDVIREGDKVLYLGTSTGTTPSHVSDIVGEKGLVIGVEFAPRVAREFIEKVARVRRNVVPYIADARESFKFASFGKVDVVYCDIAQQDQTEIAIENCARNLRTGGRLILIVKSRSIDVLRDPKEVFREESSKLERHGLTVEKVIELSPFDKDHALISALWNAA
ncbi:MAG: fibrillarin-like rRNA/tRNA 2'-O-methyltransferase [Thaumarchaeota archaeon]|nr:fibrillarin-like rRNA/tRNA 2'-O-methyltransferase [Nitrososphaerota archaeon]